MDIIYKSHELTSFSKKYRKTFEQMSEISTRWAEQSVIMPPSENQSGGEVDPYLWRRRSGWSKDLSSQRTIRPSRSQWLFIFKSAIRSRSSWCNSSAIVIYYCRLDALYTAAARTTRQQYGVKGLPEERMKISFALFPLITLSVAVYFQVCRLQPVILVQ